MLPPILHQTTSQPSLHIFKLTYYQTNELHTTTIHASSIESALDILFDDIGFFELVCYDIS